VRRTGVGAIERGTLIRAAIDRTDDTLYFTLVLLTWSLLYFGIAHYRSSLQTRALAHEARLAALRYSPPLPVQCAQRPVHAHRREAQPGGLQHARAAGRVPAGDFGGELDGDPAPGGDRVRASLPGARAGAVRRPTARALRGRRGAAGRARPQPDPPAADRECGQYGVGPREDGSSIVVRARPRNGMLALRSRTTARGCPARRGDRPLNTRASRQRTEAASAARSRRKAWRRVALELPLSPA
jgi:hypothetical protein